MSPLFVILLCCAATIQAAPRIIGGSDAPDGKYPYQVSLRVPPNDTLQCGGSILNKRWILTAAHCITGVKSLKIVAGTNLIKGGKGENYESEFLIYHEKYNSLTSDIGLIRVNRDIVYTDKIKPINLPTGNFTKVDYPANLTGWGVAQGGKLPNKLQEISLKVIDQNVCRDIWKSIGSSITDSHICTFTKHGEGACYGDSGSPLVADGVQIGIVSYGQPCAEGYPDVFTRVPTFIEWINNTINEYEKTVK